MRKKATRTPCIFLAYTPVNVLLQLWILQMPDTKVGVFLVYLTLWGVPTLFLTVEDKGDDGEKFKHVSR